MTLLHLAGGMVGVTLWFVLVALVLRRSGPDHPPIRVLGEITEGVLFTLFAALWFASLGHGAWWVLFGVLGILLEGPVRARHLADAPPVPWRRGPAVIGIVRVVVAGGILSVLL